MALRYTRFIGADISKKTIDFCVIEGQTLMHSVCNNMLDAISAHFKNHLSINSKRNKKTLFCFENTGPYQNHLITFLTKKRLPFTIPSALHIKLSMGLVRGKSDKLDAQRIAQFAARSYPSLRLWEQPRLVVQSLKSIWAVRRRLLAAKTLLEGPVKEVKMFESKMLAAAANNAAKRTLDALKADIKAAEQQMLALVQGDDAFSRTGGGAIKLAEELREKYGVTVLPLPNLPTLPTPVGYCSKASTLYSHSMIITCVSNGRWLV